MVDASINVVNDIFKHHRNLKFGSSKQRGVTRYVFTHSPENSRLARLGCARAEQLAAAEPQASNAGVLFAFARSVKLEDHAGPGAGAIGRRGVAGGEGRFVDGVGEGVAE